MEDAKRLKLKFSSRIMTNLELLAQQTGSRDVGQLFAESLGMLAETDETVEVLEVIDTQLVDDLHELTLDINPMVADVIMMRARNENMSVDDVIRLSVGQLAVESGHISFN